jgi:hypothetical protein
MPNSKNSIRHLVILELFERVAARLPGWRVDPAWPGDELELEAVYVAGAQGPVTVPLMGAGRSFRDDRFDVTVIVQGGSPQSVSRESMERAALGLAAVEDVLAEDPTLGDLPGLLEIGQSAQVDGPTTFPARNGVFTYYTLTISAEARYD